MTRQILIDHLARVEGHGGLLVELDGAAVRRVEFRVTEGLRLVEGLIRGRHFTEVAPIVSRICAICSVAHTLTSIMATEDAFGIVPSPQTLRLRDLLYRGENIESHALHLFLLALPDYYGFSSAVAMAGKHRDAVELGLRLKRLGNAIQELIGGRAIHPVNAVVGGFASVPSETALLAVREDLLRGMADAERAVEMLAALPPMASLESDTTVAALRPTHGDYGYARGCEIVLRGNGVDRVVPVARYRDTLGERAVSHSHAKVSEVAGVSFMVGALARLTLQGELLTARARAVAQRLGLRTPSRNPLDNNLAQAVELVHDIERSLAEVEWLLEAGLRVDPPASAQPCAGEGIAVTEAPRGLLVHHYTYADDGRVAAANVVTPTAINAASIEHRAAAAATEGAGLSDAELARRLEVLVRAYDPCLSCSVHVIRRPL